MSLTLPSVADLQNHKEAVSDADALQQAADLFVLATGLTADPTDEVEQRMVRLALLEMAWAIQTRHEDQEESFSPFSSERIGSYSYTKAQAAINARHDTGVPAFDAAVAYFLALAMGGMPVTDSEWVFQPGYTETPESEIGRDPSRIGFSTWPSTTVEGMDDEPEILILQEGTSVPPGTPDNTLVVFI